MNMAMDKPTALNSTEGTRGRQAKNAKNELKKTFLGLGKQNMNMPMDKPIVLNSTEGTRGPQVINAKIRFPGLANWYLWTNQ